MRRAELAVQKGDDELAREALKRKKSYQVGGMAVPLPAFLGPAAIHAHAVLRRPGIGLAFQSQGSFSISGEFNAWQVLAHVLRSTQGSFAKGQSLVA